MKHETKAAALHFLGLASLILSTDDTDEAKNIKAEVDTTRHLCENYERLILIRDELIRDEERERRIAEAMTSDNIEPLKAAAESAGSAAQG